MTSSITGHSHVAVCPGAGIGHKVPFLRLAAMLAATNTCRVTLVINPPTLSVTETTLIDSFLTTHSEIKPYYFHTLTSDPSHPAIIDDHFLHQHDLASRSAHALADELSTLSPPLSAVFSDFLLSSRVNRPLSQLGIPSFTLVVTSARFFSLMPTLLLDGPIVKGKDVVIPGIKAIRADEPPPSMCDMDHPISQLITTNVAHLTHAKGILVNTFDSFESDTLSALGTGRIFPDLPPVFPIGPLHPLQLEKAAGSTGRNYVGWLEKQAAKSVVFVSLGSRTSMGKDQIKEIAQGLHRSGTRFLWVIKTTLVEHTNLVGHTFFEQTKNKGLVLKDWVNQEEVLSHPSIGGFLTHCGWNSVLESAQHGIPLLAWPPGGDQRVNAAVMKDAGLGIWERRWGMNNQGLIMADEIKDKIVELMTSDELRASVKKVGEEAKKAWEADGSSTTTFNKIVDMISMN